jgi:hypothetical protein
LVYVKEGLNILPCDTGSSFNQHCKFVFKTNSESLHFYLIYRPPSSNQENLTKLENLLKHSEINSIFIGDFNLPEIDWNNYSAPNKYTNILNICLEKGFEQLVDFPTHDKGNILDLVLTNSPHLIQNINDCGKIGSSDHCLLSIEILSSYKETNNTSERFNWNRADFDSISEGLNAINWKEDLYNLSTEEAWKFFCIILNDLTEKYVPRVKMKSNSHPSWMSRDLLKSIRKKRRVWKEYRVSGELRKYEEYKDLEKHVKSEVKRLKKQYEKKLSKMKTNNKKCFNGYLKNKLKNRTGIGPLSKPDGEVTNLKEEMVEILNQYFGSVFTHEDTSSLPDCARTESIAFIQDLEFNEALIISYIKNLKKSNSSGPDGMTVTLLQEVSNSISVPLACLFRKSMQEGIVPQDWKDAIVVPIFKKGVKSKPSNYRPVSLTSVVCKLMERIVKDVIQDHLLKNNLLHNSQHGFLPHKSCTSNLLEFLEVITQEIDKGTPVDVLYLDFSKAFDKVPHQRLLLKIESLNIQGNILNWIKDWLKNRRQKVVIDNLFSLWILVISGVPQGSVLGPLLFIIYINDLDEAARRALMTKKFADDSKIANKAVSQEDREVMQDCIDNLVEWSEKWGMVFNTEKCKIMHFGSGNPEFNYTMSGCTLSSVEEERDIGVLINKDLKPSRQCEVAVNRAKMVLGQLTRSFHFRDRNVFLRLFTTYVRPHLEFSTPVWAPTSQQDIRSIENVQIQAVNMISGLRAVGYTEKLKELGLLSLETRRTRYDLIQTYKTLEVEGDEFWFKRVNQVSGRTTRQSDDRTRLTKQRSNTTIRSNFFTQRVIDDWNQLPSTIRESQNIKIFKRNLDQYLSSSEMN